MSSLLYELKGIGKEYAGPAETLTVLRNIDLDISQGDTLAIVGASGSGKTTLLHLLGTLDVSSHGTILFDGRDITAIGENERAKVRNKDIGFVFQFHHLLPEFNTLENVAMQGLISGLSRETAFELAHEAIDRVGLSERALHRVTTLSGGERQRAAMARAILMKPRVLLADEPTGNLDGRTGELVADQMLQLNRDLGMTLVVVTHNHELAHRMDRRLELRSGELYAEST